MSWILTSAFIIGFLKEDYRFDHTPASLNPYLNPPPIAETIIMISGSK
jgi:hypothetical protein